ncbi:5-oxoprolinase subunit C family protein [Tuwongella immobilis]|uniref:Carboxyltransferase domain-containing protein n=1 Tax=Tuwongella immobilis TaxID=692036 RepID=A0A6C2YHN4_9BACT|nr:biotin-dependent carboxyltransferase family protein [Tuwongella immobilis]VIP01038.1 Urea amidolyase-like protein OS=Alicyclobacillus hesperidum URH17-3-68 GN=URH17368_0618 PE=4 SV=1: AHS2 [Tuwongella immobilis]VTR97501.1 Urea amidolyase-like protein OS=Alicyclobacillus hesperidum URH17-3-68 GN=URH17368_0618 PE=4 SV=1: AHS2 [Tuwongella immobilis]
MTLEVLHPGAHSLLVDAGRPHSRSLGLPIGGAADQAAWKIANALVGNSPPQTALEIALSGPQLRATQDCVVALWGAPFDVRIDDTDIPAGRVMLLRAGQVLKIGGTPIGMRAYLTTPGGWIAPKILGSTSALAPIASGNPLTPANLPIPLPIRTNYLPEIQSARLLGNAASQTTNSAPTQLRILPGPHAQQFADVIWNERIFHVTPASNRMGLRLRGDPLRRTHGEILSEPVAPGTIQVTHDGQCIILGRDGQTIGGYPKIAHVIQADWDLLAQLRPEQALQLHPVSAADAHTALAARTQSLADWLARINASQ